MERGGRGLNAPSSSPGPGGDSHALATQLLIKAPATKCPDNYVATHRAPRLRAARAAEGLSARRGAAQPGRAQPRSRASTSPAAEPSRAEPSRAEPGRAEPGRTGPSRAERSAGGAQAAGASAQPRGSGCIASGLRPPPLCCLPRRLPGAPPSARGNSSPSEP